jgi:Protein of unknown function (DUF2786)
VNHEEAVSKAVRLLKLSQSSDFPHEAANAAARAQEIIDRYKLAGLSAESDIPGAAREPEEEIRQFEDPLEVGEGKNLSRWRVTLASTLARANQSRIYTVGTAIKIVGRPSDAETIRYMYQYLVNEVERLTRVHAKGNGKTWANNFRLGIVDEIRDRLKAQREETIKNLKTEMQGSVPGSAVVRVDQALAKMEHRGEDVEEWMDKNMSLRKTYARIRSDYGAREAGRQAGKSIQLGGGKGLTSGA